MSVDNIANNKRIAKNTLFMIIQNVFGLLVSLYTSRIVLQNLGVDDYGILNVVAGFVSMFAFLNSSLINGTQRFYNFELGKKGIEGAKNVYNSAIRIQIIMAIIVLIAIETIGIWFLNNKLVIEIDRLSAANWVFQFSVVSMIIIILQVPYGAAIMAHERFGLYALMNMTDVVLKLIIVLLLPIIPGDKLKIYGSLLLIITLFNFLLMFVYSKKNFIEVRLTNKFDICYLREMLTFSGWNAFGAFANMMQGQGVNMVLNLFFGPVVNAARAIAYQINGALQGLVNNMSVTIKPQLTQSYAKGDLKRTYSLMYTMSKISDVILFALSLPILIEIDYILRIWLGNNVPAYTSVFCIFVIITTVITNLNAPVSYVVHATGKMRTYQLICSSILLSSVLFAYLILSFGYSPSSVFLVIASIELIKHIVSLLLLKRLTPFSIKDYTIKVLVPLCLFFICVIPFPLFLHFYITDSSLIKLIVIFVVSEFVTILMMYIIVLDRPEKKIFKLTLSRFSSKLYKEIKTNDNYGSC